MYKVFVVSSGQYYRGECLLGAESEEDALQFIRDYKKGDPKNEGDSFGWSDSVYEVPELSSTVYGIILNNICYAGF
jgi:hypothetical protein